MNRSQVVFKAIDVAMNKKQNGAVQYNGIRIDKDIAYSDYSMDTTGDIYVREDLYQKGEKLPVVLNIHGGGWLFGDAEGLDLQSQYLANHLGCFVVNVLIDRH